jgi:hypothetical protein
MLAPILLFTATFASASEPSSLDKPEAPPTVSGECAKIYGLDVGGSFPAGILDDEGKATCSALLVPISQYQDLLQIEVWGDYVSSRYRLDTELLTLQRDWYKEAVAEKTPLFQRPGVLIGVGTVAGVAAVAVSAWALSTISE